MASANELKAIIASMGGQLVSIAGTGSIPQLVNDLDLVVRSPSNVRAYPWTLGGTANPGAPAVQTQENHLDNIEQVFVANPEPDKRVDRGLIVTVNRFNGFIVAKGNLVQQIFKIFCWQVFHAERIFEISWRNLAQNHDQSR